MSTKVIYTHAAVLSPAPNATLPFIRVFEHDRFEGDVLEVIGGGPINAIDRVAHGWNDKISSIIVVSGVWEFFQNIDFGSDPGSPGSGPMTLPPGTYPSVEDVGRNLQFTVGARAGWNDSISSLRAKSF